MKKAFQDMLHGLGGVNPTHAYYNGSRTSKDNEDPSCIQVFKDQENSQDNFSFGRLYLIVFVLVRNISPFSHSISNSLSSNSLHAGRFTPCLSIFKKCKCKTYLVSPTSQLSDYGNTVSILSKHCDNQTTPSDTLKERA
ncbi:hypothetical protein Tco_0115731 [Tanacetum coccineum]